MKSDATSVDAYLAALPPERRAPLGALRELVLKHLPEGYVEAMNWGMISYEVPLEASGRTYNGQPLMYAALGNQKRHMGLYLCGVSCIPGGREALEARFRQAGKKLDMGKACLRFRSLEELDLDTVAECIASVPLGMMIAASAAAPRKR